MESAELLQVPSRRRVDVIAKVHHEVQVMVDEVTVRGEAAPDPFLARHEAEGELLRARGRRRHRSGAPRTAPGAPGGEAVPVPPVCGEATNSDVHAVRVLGTSDDGPRP